MSKPPRKAKATVAIVAQRVEEVLRIRLDGAEFWDVREYAREKEAEDGSPWKLADDDKPLSDGQLWRYIGRADALIAESCRASRKKLLRRHLAQRRNLYAKAVSQGDVRAALAVLDSEAKMLGLADAELSGLVERLAREIEHLKATYGNGSNPQTTGAAAGGPEGDAAGGDAGPGAVQDGPGESDDRGGHDAGPLASETVAEEVEPGLAPLFPAGGQEPGCGSADAG